jgi:hypothetical protein
LEAAKNKEESMISSGVAVEEAVKEDEAAEDMQWIKVPKHHDFKSAYFQGSRGAIFLMDEGDKTRGKPVLERKGKKWSHVLAYEFAYLAVRVKRKIPAPAQLHARIKAVFNFFAGKLIRNQRSHYAMQLQKGRHA